MMYLPDKSKLVVPMLGIGGELRRNHSCEHNYDLLDSLSNTRGLLKLYRCGTANITFESPENPALYKPVSKYETLIGKIVHKSTNDSATVEQATEDPRKYAVSFSKVKNTLLHEGRDKNGDPVLLKYKGGFYFPFDKLEKDLCRFGASFSTETVNSKAVCDE
jgi:hypothetical protein